MGGMATWKWIQERRRRRQLLQQSRKADYHNLITESDAPLLPTGGTTGLAGDAVQDETATPLTLSDLVKRRGRRTLGVDVPVIAKPSKITNGATAPPSRRHAWVPRPNLVADVQRRRRFKVVGDAKREDDDDEVVRHLHQEPQEEKDQQQALSRAKLPTEILTAQDIPAVPSRPGETLEGPSSSSKVDLDVTDGETSGGNTSDASEPRPQEVRMAAVHPVEHEPPASPASTSAPVSSMDRDLEHSDKQRVVHRAAPLQELGRRKEVAPGGKPVETSGLSDSVAQSKPPDSASPSPTLDEGIAPVRPSFQIGTYPRDPRHTTGELLRPKSSSAVRQEMSGLERAEASAAAGVASVAPRLLCGAVGLAYLLRWLRRRAPGRAAPRATERGTANRVVGPLAARLASGGVRRYPFFGERQNRRHLSSGLTDGGRTVHPVIGRLPNQQGLQAPSGFSMAHNPDLPDQGSFCTPCSYLTRQFITGQWAYTVLEAFFVLPESARLASYYTVSDDELHQQWTEVLGRHSLAAWEGASAVRRFRTATDAAVSVQAWWRRRATAAARLHEVVPGVLQEIVEPAVHSEATNRPLESRASSRVDTHPAWTVTFVEQDEGILGGLLDFFRGVYPSCSFEADPSTKRILFTNKGTAGATPESARACLEHALRVCREDGHQPEDFLLLRLRVERVDGDAAPAEELVFQCRRFHPELTPQVQNFSCVGHYVDVSMLSSSSSPQTTGRAAQGTAAQSMPGRHFAPPFPPDSDLRRSRVAQLFGLRHGVEAARKSLEQTLAAQRLEQTPGDWRPQLFLPLGPAMQSVILSEGVRGVTTSNAGLLLAGFEGLGNVGSVLSRLHEIRKLPLFLVFATDPVLMRFIASARVLEASVQEAKEESDKKARIDKKVGIHGSPLFSAKAVPSWTARCLVVSSDNCDGDGFRDARLLHDILERQVKAWRRGEIRTNVRPLLGSLRHATRAGGRGNAMVWPWVVRRLSEEVGVSFWLDGNLLRGRLPAGVRPTEVLRMRRQLEELVGRLIQQVSSACPGDGRKPPVGAGRPSVGHLSFQGVPLDCRSFYGRASPTHLGPQHHGNGRDSTNDGAAAPFHLRTTAYCIPDQRASSPPGIHQTFPQQWTWTQQAGAAPIANRWLPGAPHRHPLGGFAGSAGTAQGMAVPDAGASHGQTVQSLGHSLSQAAVGVSIGPNGGAYSTAPPYGGAYASGPTSEFSGASALDGCGGGQGGYHASTPAPSFVPVLPIFVGVPGGSVGGASFKGVPPHAAVFPATNDAGDRDV